jgi:hypothetical protein
MTKRLTKAEQQRADYILENQGSAEQQLQSCLSKLLGTCQVIETEAKHLFAEVKTWQTIHGGQAKLIRDLNSEIESLKQQLADKTTQGDK